MNEIKALIPIISFWFLEKYKLRKHYGKSRPSNFGDTKRNDIFYNNLENELKPILESKNYFKARKRIFINKQVNTLSYVFFALNKQLNGMCIDYGEFNYADIDENDDKIINKIKSNTRCQRLKPDFWKYDYQYPVRRNDKFDKQMIFEIKNLLIEKLK